MQDKHKKRKELSSNGTAPDPCHLGSPCRLFPQVPNCSDRLSKQAKRGHPRAANGDSMKATEQPRAWPQWHQSRLVPFGAKVALTRWPAGPANPAGPASPVGPACPAGSTDPVGPADFPGPTDPAGPAGPVGPAGPACPADPFAIKF